MKKLIITLLCLAIVSGGCWFGYRQYQKNKDEKRIVDVVPVSLLVDDYIGFDDNTSYDAEVTSGSTQKVVLANDKMVKEVKVSIGDEVKKGDVLLEYDMTLAELETAQKKNQIAVLEQTIKDEEKELVRIQNLLPSESAPRVTPTPDPDPVPEPEPEPEPEFEDTSSEENPMPQPEPSDDSKGDDSSLADGEYDVPLKLLEEITSADQGEINEADGIVYFSCGYETAVTADFMQSVIDEKLHIVLNVYGENDKLMYFWDIDPENDDKLEVYDWKTGDGVVVKNGMISYDGSAAGKCGLFFVYTPAYDSSLPDDMGGDMPTDIEGDLPDIDPDDLEGMDGFDDMGEFDMGDLPDVDGGDLFDDFPSTDTTTTSENYVYTRAQLAKMAKDKTAEIKELKVQLKQEQLEYKDSLKRSEEGVERAKIDGVVTKVGSDTYSAPSSDLGMDYGMDMGMDFGMDDMGMGDMGMDMGMDMGGLGYDDGMGMYSDDSDSYITVQGSAGVSLDINVGELNLNKFAEGTVLNGMCYETGESFTAVVTGHKDEPSSYSSMNWNDNPNSSTYVVTADVTDLVRMSVGNWVSISEPDAQAAESSSSIYMPIHYLHKEGSQYYVMKADKDGRLKKQYVKSGKILWDSYLEIKGGIKRDDKICFPYGKDVKEGVKTRETDEIEW